MRPVRHPLSWTVPLRPDGLLADGITVVEEGAWVAGARADALVVLDMHEANRRSRASVDGVTSLPLLDALLNLPWDTPVLRADLSMRTSRILEAAADGILAWDGRWVIRLLRPPLTVVAVVARGAGWREPVSRVAHFADFAQQVVIVPTLPPAAANQLWEAQVAGIGVWVLDDHGHLDEVVAPEPFEPRYFKPATWRFAERAYSAFTRRPNDRQPWSRAPAGHPVQPVGGG